METRKFLPVMFALVLMTCGSASAQIIHGTPISGGLAGQYTSWTITDSTDAEETISQFAVSFNGLLPIKDNLELAYGINNASSSLDDGDSDYSLNGLGDLSLQLSQSLAEDRLLLSFGANVPTGKTELDLAEERRVLQVLSQDFLQMPVRQFGQGFGFNVIVGGAAPLGENARGGIGVSYKYNGSYDPYVGISDYDPGDAFNVNAGIDIGTDSARLSLEGIFATFTNDQLNGKDVFKQSSQLDMRVSGLKAGESVTWSGVVRYLIRGDNELLDAAGADLEAFQLYGNEFAAAGAAMFRMSPDFFAGPSVQYRAIAESDAAGSSSVIGGGGAFSASPSPSIALNGGFTYYTGDADGGDFDLSGYTVTLGLSAGL